jgi:hypothetical protein
VAKKTAKALTAEVDEEVVRTQTSKRPRAENDITTSASNDVRSAQEAAVVETALAVEAARAVPVQCSLVFSDSDSSDSSDSDSSDSEGDAMPTVVPIKEVQQLHLPAPVVPAKTKRRVSATSLLFTWTKTPLNHRTDFLTKLKTAISRLMVRMDACEPPWDFWDKLSFNAFVKGISPDERRRALTETFLGITWSTPQEIVGGIRSENAKERMCALLLRWLMRNDPASFWEFCNEYWGFD